MQGLTKLMEAANNGDAQAQIELARLYASGDGVDADQEAAFRWFKKAADAGHLQAALEVASRYENGIGVKTECPFSRVYLSQDRGERGHDCAIGNGKDVHDRKRHSIGPGRGLSSGIAKQQSRAPRLRSSIWRRCWRWDTSCFKMTWKPRAGIS